MKVTSPEKEMGYWNISKQTIEVEWQEGTLHCCGTAPMSVKYYAGFQQNRDSKAVEYQSTSVSLSRSWVTAETNPMWFHERMSKQKFMESDEPVE